MSAMALSRLLLTGASGYIGGTILKTLLEEKEPWTSKYKIAALVRKNERATKLRDLGVEPVVFNSLDDSERLTAIASDFDVIIHAAAGWHTASARALIKGLGSHKNKQTYYLHISGTSNLSGRPHSAGYIETRTFSDKEDTYSYEKYRASFEVYMQRTTDIAVIEEGEKYNVLGREIGWIRNARTNGRGTFKVEIEEFQKNPPAERDVPKTLRRDK